MTDALPRETRAPDMLEDVREGLSRPLKELSPKYFYDFEGSRLFEQITRLPEYYPTGTERALLEEWMPDWIARLRPGTLVELGAGSAAKTRIILDTMTALGEATYVPVDVSAEFLEETAAGLRAEYPGLRVQPLVADISGPLDLPSDTPRPRLVAFLGSTIGNFPWDASISLLGNVAGKMAPDDRFLLGVDLIKDRSILEAAYNDAQGVTAAFNLNILRVLNRELGADFNTEAFRHRAFYDAEHRRIEMHLVSLADQSVHVPGAGTFTFRAGESMRTEISRKYDRARTAALFEEAGLRLDAWQPDARCRFALALGSVA